MMADCSKCWTTGSRIDSSWLLSTIFSHHVNNIVSLFYPKLPVCLEETLLVIDQFVSNVTRCLYLGGRVVNPTLETGKPVMDLLSWDHIL